MPVSSLPGFEPGGYESPFDSPIPLPNDATPEEAAAWLEVEIQRQMGSMEVMQNRHFQTTEPDAAALATILTQKWQEAHPSSELVVDDTTGENP